MGRSFRRQRGSRVRGPVRQSRSKLSELDRREREECLTRLGFVSYQAYVASRMWKDIRAKVLDRDGGLCVRCGNPAVLVHHQCYNMATMSGESLVHLKSVCERCHNRSHFSPRLRGEKSGRIHAGNKLAVTKHRWPCPHCGCATRHLSGRKPKHRRRCCDKCRAEDRSRVWQWSCVELKKIYGIETRSRTSSLDQEYRDIVGGCPVVLPSSVNASNESSASRGTKGKPWVQKRRQ